jgi:signal transduction histidine kinase
MILKNTWFHSCFQFFLFSIFLICSGNAQGHTYDFSGEEFNLGKEYELKGSWDFYWNEFPALDSDTSSTSIALTSVPIQVKIPSTWNKYQKDDKYLPVFGFGTYKATVKLPHNFPSDLAILTNRVKMAHAIYINGEYVGGDGIPSSDPTKTRNSQNLTLNRIKNLPADGKLEIAIVVANYVYPRGGMDEIPTIGFYPLLENKQNRQIILSAFMAGAFILIGMYHLALWYRRKVEFPSLIFSLFCLTGAFRMFFSGTKLAIIYNPNISAEWMLTLDFLSVFLAIPLMHYFVSLIFPNKYNKTIRYISLSVCTFLTGVSVLGDLYTVALIVPYFEAYVVLVFINILYIGISSIFNKRESAILFTVVFLVVIVSGINDILLDRGLIHSYYSFHIGILIFIFAQAVVLSRRFTNVFVDLEQLNRTLETQVDDRTKELVKAKSVSDKLHQETKLLSLRLNDVLEEERKTIAMVLHDSMGASLIGVRMKVSSLKSKVNALLSIPEELNVQFDSAVDELNFIYTKNRTLVRNLRPELIDVLGLKAAIESLINDYNSNNVFYIDFKVIGYHTNSIPKEASIPIFRICQEAVTNIIKYANANEVEITLEVDDSALKLQITDNGVGFDVQKIIGIGLIGMREKVDNLKGRFDIQSDVGKGTRITIEIPI